MNWSNNRNLTMLVDFYELTMSNGYFEQGYGDQVAVFDMFFRKIPDGGGFAICAGLEQLVEYVKNLHFTEDDIDYLRSKKMFSEQFLQYLRGFHFSGDIWAMKEGTPIFPNEPVVTVIAPIIEAQLIETMVLLTVTFQSLVAPKANRIVRLFWGPEPRSSADAQVLPAPSPTGNSRVRPWGLWPTAGSSFLTANTRLLRLMQKFIRTAAPCWWILTAC